MSQVKNEFIHLGTLTTNFTLLLLGDGVQEATNVLCLCTYSAAKSDSNAGAHSDTAFSACSSAFYLVSLAYTAVALINSFILSLRQGWTPTTRLLSKRCGK